MTKKNQLTQGKKRRVMYVENKQGNIDGERARIGWVTFSKTGLSVHYRGKTLNRSTQTISGNYFDVETGEEYWVSGIKKRGSNVHWASNIQDVPVDEDAKDEYQRLKSS